MVVGKLELALRSLFLDEEVFWEGATGYLAGVGGVTVLVACAPLFPLCKEKYIAPLNMHSSSLLGRLVRLWYASSCLLVSR